MISAPVQVGRVRRRRHLHLAAVVTAVGCLSAAGAATAGAVDKHPSHAANTITVYAFQEGSLIVVPGTSPSALSQGDEEIVNDQLTATHAGPNGYHIFGHDAGVCTFTRIVNSHDGLANCDVTAVLKGGSLTAQGVIEISAGAVEPSDLAITGGTGKYATSRGTVHIKDTTGHEIFTINLR